MVNCAKSRVLAWQMLTVASCCISISAIGFPTMLLAPTTTTFLPSIGIRACSSSFTTPNGVQGGNTVPPATSPPDIVKVKAIDILLDGNRMEYSWEIERGW